MIWSKCDLQNYSYLIQTDNLCLGVVFFFVRIRQLLKANDCIENIAVCLLNGLNVRHIEP